MIKSYNDLVKLTTFQDRFLYLSVHSNIGVESFGTLRFLNQQLYQSDEWRTFRRKIILRDNGCEMGLKDYPIVGTITVHHINPITVEDVLARSQKIFDPNNVICVSDKLHKAIHYGDETIIKQYTLIERYEGDTIPWR